MAKFGDLPEAEIGSDPDERPSRRFSGLVGPSAVRKLSPRRLAWGVLGAAVLLAILGVGGSRAIRGLTHWVADRPENVIPFAEIRLEPEVPSWFLPGSAGFLESVRSEAKLPERLPILAFDPKDLKDLTRDFRRHPLVEQVDRVEVGRRRLVVRLAFRKPIAVVEPGDGSRIVIDKDGVILPSEEIDWAEQAPRARVRGIDDPLPRLIHFAKPGSIRPGLPYRGRSEGDGRDECDPEVLKAARLAEFFRRQAKVTALGRPAPDFQIITPTDPADRSDGFFAIDGRGNFVYWGSAPGAEPPDGIAAVEKWRMLMAWIDRKGPIDLTSDRYLWFKRSVGVTIDRLKPRSGPSGRSAISPSR